ncbi:hypothetical protein CVU82_03710 [Candidatus Falkowbacteria bacterium HGW-Falkowbacteria-1]|uniref:Type II secretion system protein GspG C-terminal domain-containing protein n=1 Tax=Candidatus Falkowbacteria bacterium HGW-Falkowbacteria-1 TaxID=2013768 RepID=A0A2N2E8S2_9BACT|nr:MAG: hypothetical protein CVU82_03710 [Candidatus Falkowbacteria bacterium HGW-Falkowbacteria-1]
MFNKKAFTLIEILLAVALLVILASIVILAINPARQLAQTRNSRRYADVNTLQKAAYQYLIDNGELPAAIDTMPLEICRTDAIDCTGLADLSVLTDETIYLSSIPTDPKVNSENGTGYMICKTIYNRPAVYSPLAELSQEINSKDLCASPLQLRNSQRLADISAIEAAMKTMYDANGYYLVDPGVSYNIFYYNGNSLVGSDTRSTNCSTVTSEPVRQGEHAYIQGTYGSSTPCPTQSNWCIKLSADINDSSVSAGTACDSGTVYLRNMPLNNYLPIGTWTTGWYPYKMFIVNNFDDDGNDYFRIKYRLEGSATNELQSDHFLNSVSANCRYDTEASNANMISCF